MGLLTYTYEDMKAAYEAGYSRFAWEEHSSSRDIESPKFPEFMHEYYPEEIENKYMVVWRLDDRAFDQLIFAENSSEANKKAMLLLKEKNVFPHYFEVRKIR